MFKTIHTAYGLAKIAAAEVSGVPIALTEMAVGDGNGNPTAPTEGQEVLVRERYRASINRVYQDPEDPTKFTAEMLVPATEGGFVIREVGVFDADGGLFAVGNVPDTYKPTSSEGAVADTVVRVVFFVTNAEVIAVTLDPNVVTATQSWVLNAITLCAVAPGGTTGQVLRKASNACGDAEWADPGDFNVIIQSIEEAQILAGAQTQVDWAVVTTDGLAVYIEGVRLTQGAGVNQWQKAAAPNDQTRIILGQSYPAGTQIVGVQNEPAGETIGTPLLRDQNLADVPDKATARTNLGVYSQAQVNALVDAAVSPGAVMHFARNTAPTGWLKANGAAVSRTTYSALFAAIGTTFGAGDGFNTFNLPDLRGEFLRGWDDGRGIDAGRAFGSFQADELKSHLHYTPTITRSSFDSTGGEYGYGQDSPSGTGPNVNTSAVGGSETRPRNRALLTCIKF